MSVSIYSVGDDQVVYVQRTQMNMKTKFHLHSYVNAQGESQIIMGVSGNGKRKRIPLGIYVKKSEWDIKNQQVKSNTTNSVQLNLIIDKHRAKIADIRMHYLLVGQPLSFEKLIEEYENKTPKFDFISFMRQQLEKMPMKESSYKKHLQQIQKFQDFKPVVSFSDINLELINDFKGYLHTERKNNKNTIISNIKIIKKFLCRAKKYGIPLNIDTDDIVIGTMSSNRNYLLEDEINKIKDYYFSQFIRNTHKLPLGYFLFSCYTGLRISDVKQLSRQSLEGKTFSFTAEKTGKPQTLILNNSARKIVQENEELFERWISEQKINKFLKEIATLCGIRKNISFHVARHTFATNFLRKGGKVEELQILLAHSKIETTMIYVHMFRAEQIDSIYLLDD